MHVKLLLNNAAKPINRLNDFIDEHDPIDWLLDFVERGWERNAPVFLGAVTAIFSTLVFGAGLLLGATPSIGYFVSALFGTLGASLFVAAMVMFFQRFDFEFGAIQRASTYVTPFVVIFAGLSAGDMITSAMVVAALTPEVTAFVALVAIPVATRLLNGIGVRFDRLYA